MQPVLSPLAEPSVPLLAKAATGSPGLDEVLNGGLPRGRPSLLCGAAGCGKTLLAMQFLVQGALRYGEPGVFIAFEERAEDLVLNVASLGVDLEDLQRRNLLSVDHVRIEPREIVENGDYDLEGLFLRLGFAIDSIGAKRVVIDTLEVLMGGLANYALVRSELRRLFEWLKERGVTAVITAERGEGKLTRHGLEEYVSDCVIVLDHRVVEQIGTRRLRVVKYRGSTHGTNEYPFLIDESGISVLPITSAGLNHAVSDERISTGIPRLDTMLGGQGYFRGSTLLISGTAGAGKTSLAAHFAAALGQRGERVLYFSFEESPAQIVRNMRAIGIDLAPLIERGLLRIVSARPTAHGLEAHLTLLYRATQEFAPSAVVLDPISNFTDASNAIESQRMLVRVVDVLKAQGITALLTSLNSGAPSSLGAFEQSNAEVSSIVDTWLLLKTVESNGERNRLLYVLKSRGMPHSNQVREFVLSDRGVELLDVYVGEGTVLTGSARVDQEAADQRAQGQRRQQLEHQRRELERRKALHREQLARLQAEFDAESHELQGSIAELERAAQQRTAER
ncbi:MAG TPA: circadian clock protein KaiC, partial [Polyangiales bacterium]|nr:circadian clock protein KaiC [Polyangiales bacterium]